MTLKAVNKTTVQEAVYEQLYQAIISGKLAPGEKVTLQKLADALEVSVMPVREAIRRLESKKLVNIQSNKQIVVNRLSRANFDQIYQIRKMLESYLVRQASSIRSEESLVELEELLAEMASAGDDEKIMEINRKFHRIIYREANLPVFEEVIDSLWERVKPYLFVLLKSDDRYSLDNFYTNHAGMLNGMKTKDADEVSKWLETDLAQAAEMIKKILDMEEKKPETNETTS